LGSAVGRNAPAWLGAWEAGLVEVAQERGVVGMEQWRAQWPEWGDLVRHNEKRFAEQSGRALAHHRWTELLQRGEEKQQKALTEQVYAHRTARLAASVGDDEAVKIRLASGPEAGAWLATGAEDLPPMADQTMRLCISRRLRLGTPCPGGERCHHRAAAGIVCGLQCVEPTRDEDAPVPDGGRHAITCAKGGGVIRRHNAVCDALMQWLRGRGHQVLREQKIPGWSWEGQEAILDLVFQDGQLGTVHVDVAVTDSAAPGHGRTALFNTRRRERAKHLRYPGHGLTAFVLDTRGAWGQEARAFAARMVAALPQEERMQAVRELRVRVARALQSALADQLASAAAVPTTLRPRL
jgi:hypothetical protein